MTVVDESFCDGNGECFRIDRQLEAAKAQLTAAHALIAQWRVETASRQLGASEYDCGACDAIDECANELEAQLTPQEARE